MLEYMEIRAIAIDNAKDGDNVDILQNKDGTGETLAFVRSQNCKLEDIVYVSSDGTISKGVTTQTLLAVGKDTVCVASFKVEVF